MTAIAEAAAEFLACRRIAVTGVSRSETGHGANVVYGRLRERGYEVVPVNPNAETIGDAPCYPDLASIPGGVEAVVIGTRPERAEATVRECIDLGIGHVWMHRGPGKGSVSPEAAALGVAHGISVIPGACPCMFEPTSDRPHRVMRRVFTVTHHIPRTV
jgi:predicted CoA-binding protein